MTSTNIHIGFGSGIKSSSKSLSDEAGMETSTRVLKPPGGGSSDIFGGTGYDTPRSGNKNQATSNIFAHPEGMSNNGLTPRRGRNNDSHNRLFGEPERSTAPSKSHSRSNIPIGGDETDRKSSVSSAVPVKTTSVSSNGHTNGKMENGGSQTNISNGNKESEDTHHLGEPNLDGLDNLDTRSVRSHQSTESLLLANNPLSENTNNIELNKDNEISDSKSEISTDNNNPAATNNTTNDLDVTSLKDADLNVSRLQNNNIFGDGNNQSNLKYGRRNMESRNCVTGVGIESPHYSARKLGTRRDGGNPVTGEGYTGSRNGLDSNTQAPTAGNATNQAATKSRVPPGGFSSGLW